MPVLKPELSHVRRHPYATGEPEREGPKVRPDKNTTPIGASLNLAPAVADVRVLPLSHALPHLGIV